MPFTRQDFESGSTDDVWQILATGGEAVVGPITLKDHYLVVHEYREAWNCRVHHEIPYDQIARRMKYPAEVAMALDAPAQTSQTATASQKP
jgi:hypothetical protein